MANLPLTGSQYWGAALNNYLRQMNSDISAVKNRLDNLQVAAAYSGSGWTGGTYNISIAAGSEDYATEYTSEPGLFEIVHNDACFHLSGELIFYNASQKSSTTIQLPENQSYLMTFSKGYSGDNYFVVHSVQQDADGKLVVAELTKSIHDTLTADGYYPLYAISSESSFTLAVNLDQMFVNKETYVLMGILKKTVDGGTKRVHFIRKTDSAFKNIYETRKGNLESFATVVPNPLRPRMRGIFEPIIEEEEGEEVTVDLKLCLASVTVDYQSNGISNGPSKASESDVDYLHPYDYRRFAPPASDNSDKSKRTRWVYQINTSEVNGQVTDTMAVMEFNADMRLGSSAFDSSRMYGVYISVFGDFLIQPRGALSESIPVTKMTNDYIWDLGSDSNFRTGGLVLLGVFYKQNGLWQYMHATTNSISPSYLSAKSVEDANLVHLPDTTYLSYISSGNSVSDVTQYSYKWIVPTGSQAVSPEAKYNVYYNTAFKASNEGTKGYSYTVPVVPYSFYTANVSTTEGSVGDFLGITIGGIKLSNLNALAEDSKLPSAYTLEIKPTREVRNYGKFVSGTFETAPSVSQENIFSSIYCINGITLADSVGASVNGPLTNVSKMEIASQFAIYEKVETADKRYSIHLQKHADSPSFSIAAVSNNVSSTEAPTLAPLVVDSSTLDLNVTGDINILAGGILTLGSGANKNIKVKNTIEFISDRRKKKNITSLDGRACLNTVKQLDAKQFQYLDSEKYTLGIIAQELEEACPEYRDMLVSIQDEIDCPQQRSVAEIKLLFILWQALREHLKGDE